MTVSDLIKQLHLMDPDKEVWANSSMGEVEPMQSSPFYSSKVFELPYSYSDGTAANYWVNKREARGARPLQSKDVVLIDVP
jgi:hypothetical protein